MTDAQINGTGAPKKPKSRAQAKRLKKRAKRAASASGTESDVQTDASVDGADTEDDSMDVDRRIKEVCCCNKAWPQNTKSFDQESVTPSLVDEILQEVQEAPVGQTDAQLSQFKDVFARFRADITEDVRLLLPTWFGAID